MTHRLVDKVLLVTGAGSGIGAETAKILATEGATLIAADINLPGAQKTVQEIVEAGGQGIAREFDLANESQVSKLIVESLEAYGRIDALFNNAALTDAAYVSRDGAIADMDVEVWDATMRINLRGTMLVCKYAIPAMEANGGGSIINASSGSGASGDTVRSAYGISKGALCTLTRYIATQYGRDRIRCNAILPGLVLTSALVDRVTPKAKREYSGDYLIPRFGSPIDIAMMVVYLASDESEWVTGQLLEVNGGQLAHLPHYAQVVGPFADFV